MTLSFFEPWTKWGSKQTTEHIAVHQLDHSFTVRKEGLFSVLSTSKGISLLNQELYEVRNSGFFLYIAFLVPNTRRLALNIGGPHISAY